MWVLTCVQKCYPEQVDITSIHSQPDLDWSLTYEMVRLVVWAMSLVHLSIRPFVHLFIPQACLR